MSVDLPELCLSVTMLCCSAGFVTMMKIEQRINLKFIVKLRKTPTECFRLLKDVYSDNVMSRTQVSESHKRFMEGWDKVEDDERPGRPSTSNTEENVEKISKTVRKDRCLSIRMIAEMVNVEKETVRQILHDQLNMRKICAKTVHKTSLRNKKTTRKTFALTSWNESQNSLMNLKMSSHVMKHGIFNTIQI
jgi:ribosome-binding protein aMBF1 (putative translation factor)